MVEFKIILSIVDLHLSSVVPEDEAISLIPLTPLLGDHEVNSLPSMKSLYNKKGAEQDLTKTMVFSQLTPTCCYIHFNLTQEDTITGPTHPCTEA